jgi:4-oxalocrotonate tautomerase
MCICGLSHSLAEGNSNESEDATTASTTTYLAARAHIDDLQREAHLQRMAAELRAPRRVRLALPHRLARRIPRAANANRHTTSATQHKEERMPLVNVKLIEDVFTPEQKGQIVERLTDAMVSIEGENMRGVTWVVVEEVRSGDWGIGGKPLHTRTSGRWPGGPRPEPQLRPAVTRACAWPPVRTGNERCAAGHERGPPWPTRSRATRWQTTT